MVCAPHPCLSLTLSPLTLLPSPALVCSDLDSPLLLYPHRIQQQSSSTLPSKYTLNPTTSSYLHCLHPGWSLWHFILGLQQQLPNQSPFSACSVLQAFACILSARTALSHISTCSFILTDSFPHIMSASAEGFLTPHGKEPPIFNLLSRFLTCKAFIIS